MNTQDTFPFKLIIKDYDLLTPLKNKEIQITNIDSKQCYDSKITTANGEVVFEIPHNERGDFFSVELINDDDYEINPYYLAKESNNVYIQSPHSQESNQQFNQESNNIDSSNFNNSNRPNYSNNPNNPSNLNNSNSFSNSNNQKHSNNPHSAHLAHTTHTKSIYQSKNTTNKILTPNNYQKCPATLYFKAKIYLYFNGFTLAIMQGNNEIASYEARSGKALTLQEKAELEQQKGYTHFVPSFTNFDYTNDFDRHSQDNSTTIKKTHQPLFHCYDKGYQDENNTIKDGEYYLSAQEIKDLLEKYESSKSKDSSKSNHSNKTNTIDNSNDLNKPNSSNSKSNDSNNTNSNHANNTDTTQFNIDLSLNIYSDKECSNSCSSIIMTNNNQIQNDILLFFYDNPHNLKYIFNHTNHTNIPLKARYSKPTISYIKFMENIEWEVDFSQEKPQIIDIAKNKQTKIQYLNHNLYHYNFPIKTPFAPGSYIELEAVMSDDSQVGNVKWSFIEIKSQTELQNFLNKNTNTSLTTHILLDSNQQPNKQYNVRVFQKNNIIDTNKLGFSLPITRGDAEETFDKYYIIVFVYDTNKKNPTLQDAYIIIDMSFRVGIEKDDAVIEATRDSQQTTQNNFYNTIIYSNDINEWNKLEHIYNVGEAVYFLNVNNAKLDKLKQNNQERYDKKDSNGNYIHDAIFDYLRIYPQLAGKIAYIYYRFDLGNEVFINNIISDNGAYQQDRQKYIKAVVEVFEKETYESEILKSKIRFREAYSNPLFDGYSLFSSQLNGKTRENSKVDFYDEREKFVVSLIKKICKFVKLQLNGAIIFNINSRAITLSDNIIIAEILLTDTNEINQNNPLETFENYSSGLIGTIIHECRHLYIFQKIYKEKQHKSPLLKYLAYSFNFYISGNYQITNAYKKLCDNNESNKVNCYVGEDNDNYQNAYEIQPNERDPRYVANKAIERLGIKQK
ncbi:hypothetical protein [Helicobacter sp. T3_23-1059]